MADTGRRKRRRFFPVGDTTLDYLHEYRVNCRTFTIYVGGEKTDLAGFDPESFEPGVEHNMADRFERNLDILSSIDPKRTILVNMASCGGHWDEGMQMFGAILACSNPIVVVAVKYARSMSSIIPLAADRFVLRPPAQYMFHHGMVSFSGLAQEAETANVELLKTREMMLRIYVARLKEQGRFKRWPEERIKEMLEKKMMEVIDVWLSADEAHEWGFADGVLGDDNNDDRGLRATTRNETRRQKMLAVIRRPINVKIEVS